MIVSKQQVPILHRIMLKSGQALTFDIRDTHTSNSICDVKVSVLSSGCGRSWYMSGQTKDYKLVFVVSPLSTRHLGVRIKVGWLGIKIM